MRASRPVLIAAVFVAGLCSLVYELLVSTVSAYFLGDGVKQFSLTIGIYLFAMGVGSWVSRYVRRDELRAFILVEQALGLLGGLSVPLLYLLFRYQTVGQFQYTTLAVIFGIGLLTGLEIPLLTRALDRLSARRENLSDVLGFDYVGALLATLLFPFLLLPIVGLYNSSLIFGAVNLLLGASVGLYFGKVLGPRVRAQILGLTLVGLTLLITLGIRSGAILKTLEAAAYPHRIVYQTQSPYQDVTLTQQGEDLRLYLNRVIQFSSRDEYRYHEALALIPAAYPRRGVRRALVLGGGEGLLARELLRLPELEAVTIVDLDTAVFAVAQDLAPVRTLNKRALADPRVQLLATDAAVFLRNDTAQYDLILADLPDPGNESLARLYSTWFYGMARQRLAPGGVFATQAASPYQTTEAYWCVRETLLAAGFTRVVPYHIHVPSFGDWGFHLACPDGCGAGNLRFRDDIKTRFLSAELLPTLTVFPPDSRPSEPVFPNTLDRPTLLNYFLADWATWQRERPVDPLPDTE